MSVRAACLPRATSRCWAVAGSPPWRDRRRGAGDRHRTQYDWTGTEGTRSGGGGGPAAPAAGRRSQAVGRHRSLAGERPSEPDRAGDVGGSGATVAVGLEEFGKAGGGVARDGASGLG